MKKLSLIVLSLLICSNSFAKVQYGSSEHFFLGAEIELQFPNGSITGDKAKVLTVYPSEEQPLELSYAEMVIFPDFIGDPDAQIGGHDFTTSLTNFKNNLNAIINQPGASYLPKILSIVNEEMTINQTNIAEHKPLEISNEDHIKFNCATGGGCDPISALVNHGLYFKISLNNYDHFGQSAIDSYIAGHYLAVEKAQNAQSEDDLKLAYAYEGYAVHFLTDLFSAGHLRTPRIALTKWCEYSDAAISSYLAKVMHDEDIKNGIWFSRSDGDTWYGFGDNLLFINDNSDNHQRMKDVVQKSADQVYAAFNHQITADDAIKEAATWAPDLEAINNNPRSQPALFSEIDGDMKEYVDGHYSTIHSCLATAIKYGFISNELYYIN